MKSIVHMTCAVCYLRFGGCFFFFKIVLRKYWFEAFSSLSSDMNFYCLVSFIGRFWLPVCVLNVLCVCVGSLKRLKTSTLFPDGLSFCTQPDRFATVVSFLHTTVAVVIWQHPVISETTRSLSPPGIFILSCVFLVQKVETSLYKSDVATSCGSSFIHCPIQNILKPWHDLIQRWALSNCKITAFPIACCSAGNLEESKCWEVCGTWIHRAGVDQLPLFSYGRDDSY